MHSLLGQILRVVLLTSLAVTLSFGLACEGTQKTETSMFESAEVDYRLGNYDNALSGYQAFLRRYPSSPLAPTAQMRVRSIHREVSSMMERPGTPRPVYHGFRGEDREEPSTEHLEVGVDFPSEQD